MKYQDYVRAWLWQEVYNTLSANTTDEKILDFADIEDGWHFGEGVPVSQRAIRDASRLHDVLIGYGFYETDAFPGLAGEVRVTAYWKDRYFEFTREGDGAWSFIEEENGMELEASERHSLTLSQAEKVVEEMAQRIWNTFAISPEGIGMSKGSDFKVWPLSRQQMAESPSSNRIAFYQGVPFVNTYDFFIQNPENPQFSGSFPMQFCRQDYRSGQHLLTPLTHPETTHVIEKSLIFPIETQNVYLKPTADKRQTVNMGTLKYVTAKVRDPLPMRTSRSNI
jgi:hypothetical protein